MKTRSFIVLLACLAATAAFAQEPSPPNSSLAGAGSATGSKAPSADRRFALTAASAGSAEIADAQLALQKSSRADVKAFAQRMVDDHTKAANQLKLVAGGEGITLPSGESKADQAETNALRQLNGAPFDRRYIEGQRKAHQQAVTLFATESKSGKDDKLKSFAGQTLPTLQEHLKMITNMPLR